VGSLNVLGLRRQKSTLLGRSPAQLPNGSFRANSGQGAVLIANQLGPDDQERGAL
jgi:hypothetical protein